MAVLKPIAATLYFTASMLMVNNAAPLGCGGRVNALGLASSSFLRAVFPTLAGKVWDLGEAAGFSPYPVYALLAAGGLYVVQVSSRALPPSLASPRVAT